MAFLIIPTDIKVSSWVKHFSRLDPGIDIRIWPEVGDADDIEFAFSLYKGLTTTSYKYIYVAFSPKEPPPPAVETPWEDVESDVIHLGDDTFKSTLKKKKHALVMFYAPCEFSLLNHCLIVL